jgi:hypothetical protein
LGGAVTEQLANLFNEEWLRRANFFF